MNRQQRRKMMRDASKRQDPIEEPTPRITQDNITRLLGEIQKSVDYTGALDNHVALLIETLVRKNILTQRDILETRELFQLRDRKRQDKIKEILSKDLTDVEILSEIEEDPNLPNYEKLYIDPIKDLNLNPYAVGLILRDKYSHLPINDILAIGRKWNLTEEHLHLKAQENNLSK